MEEVNECLMEFEWIRVLSDDRAPYTFPQPTSRSFKAKYSNPAVYRWAIFNDDKLVKVYYGEAEILARRIDNYRRGNKSQQTAKRIHELLLGLESHLRIDLDVLNFEPFLMNGVKITVHSLGEKHVRCFIENMLIITHPKGVELLNKTMSVSAKQAKKATDLLERLPPFQRRQFLSHLERDLSKGQGR